MSGCPATGQRRGIVRTRAKEPEMPQFLTIWLSLYGVPEEDRRRPLAVVRARAATWENLRTRRGILLTGRIRVTEIAADATRGD